MTINFFSPTGGVGLTTVAAAYILTHAPKDRPVWVGVDTPQQQRHLTMVCGASGPPQAERTWNDLRMSPGGMLIGVMQTAKCEPTRPLFTITDHYDADAVNILVTTADYARLAEIMLQIGEYRLGPKVGTKQDGVVVFNLPERTLTTKDVAYVLRWPIITTMPYDPRVSRMVDAGLMSNHLPTSLRDVVDDIHAFLPRNAFTQTGDSHAACSPS